MGNQTSDSSKGWGERIKSMFSPSKSLESDVTSSLSNKNPDNIQIGETYEHYGTRICGKVTADLTCLPPYLQRVYHLEHSKQISDEELQNEAREKIMQDIKRKNIDIDDIQIKMKSHKNEIDEDHTKIEELKKQEAEIKIRGAQTDKDARLKRNIGLFILVPLTIYLFIFYSSTFYSAFFASTDQLTGLGGMIFNPNALQAAANTGLFELAFVLLAPIIFLALGFVLHFFAVQKEKIKYFKMAVILLVNLMFDCILAYKIGEQMHTIGIIVGNYPVGQEYTISMSVHDINTWAVIFCGFIAYVIWGIVFDMIMTANSMMDRNKTELELIRKKIEGYEASIKDLKKKLNYLQDQRTAVKKQIAELEEKMTHKVFFDSGGILKEMNNFFSGWIVMMKILACSVSSQDKARQIFDEQVNVLIKEPEKYKETSLNKL